MGHNYFADLTDLPLFGFNQANFMVEGRDLWATIAAAADGRDSINWTHMYLTLGRLI
jgi:hypothetical protein